jgi:hypothetical protein
MYSNLTWNAYSNSGGASLYRGDDRLTSDRAKTVSAQRPVTGGGAEGLFRENISVAQAIDRSEVSADAVVDTDVDTWPSLLTHRTEIVLPGHSEYWTKTMYDSLTSARNRGCNIVDFGANEIYWQARVSYAGAGIPASMFVARSVEADPLATIHPELTTVRWRDQYLRRDGAAVIGQSYTAVRAHASLAVWSVPNWLDGIPGLRHGNLIDDAASGEVNGVQDTSSTPPNLQIIGLAYLHREGSGTTSAAMTYYTTPAGGAVFDTGSINWPCLMMNGVCGEDTTTLNSRQIMWAISSRALTGFARKNWGSRHPSVKTTMPSLQQLPKQLPLQASGVFGQPESPVESH